MGPCLYQKITDQYFKVPCQIWTPVLRSLLTWPPPYHPSLGSIFHTLSFMYLKLNKLIYKMKHIVSSTKYECLLPSLSWLSPFQIKYCKKSCFSDDDDEVLEKKAADDTSIYFI